MKGARLMGLKALGAGLGCWAVNVGLTVSLHRFSPGLVLLGVLAVGSGSVLAIWGESFKTMPPAQKIPAGLIALGLVALVGLALARWLEALNG